MSIKRQ